MRFLLEHYLGREIEPEVSFFICKNYPPPPPNVVPVGRLPAVGKN